MNLNIARLNNR